MENMNFNCVCSLTMVLPFFQTQLYDLVLVKRSKERSSGNIQKAFFVNVHLWHMGEGADTEEMWEQFDDSVLLLTDIM